MSIKIRKVNQRQRSKKTMAHKPSGFGKGKWHSRSTLWRWKRAERRRRQIANESRRRNR